jgi:hypothetical protein
MSTYHGKSWEEYLENRIHICANKLFKGRKYFEHFLIKYNKVPNKDELIAFYYNRYITANKVQTLPYLTEVWSNNFISEYTTVMQ